MEKVNRNKYRKYDFTVLATDVVIFTIKSDLLQVLLVKMKKQPYLDSWACPGGLVKPTESVEEAAKKHLHDKAGVNNVYLEQLYTFGAVDRDPFGRVVSVAYFALIPNAGLELKTTKEYDNNIDWFPITALPKLAYDHREIVKQAAARLRAKLIYTNIVYSLLPSQFTMAELQHVYEIILDRKLDKRNFWRKFQSLSLIEKVGNKKKIEGAHRPAQLHRFKRREPQMVEVL